MNCVATTIKISLGRVYKQAGVVVLVQEPSTGMYDRGGDRDGALDYVRRRSV